MITAAKQPDVLAQIESRYVELLEGLSELEARVAAALEVLLPRKDSRPDAPLPLASPTARQSADTSRTTQGTEEKATAESPVEVPSS
ncbi:MAG: hypothetical protein NZ899_13295 [Thermoguttaceae bacterium]|nr:hypothetical protein [Thermoguttaceae bacterium]MDW8080055.1 hypothetical protein [Thermoguttaceae bacterium]